MNPGRRKFPLALAALCSMRVMQTAAAQEVPGATRRSFVTSDGVTLSYLESAAAAAPATGTRALTIVLLPGWCMPASIWRAQLDGLGARFRTLALDPRGQGDSEVPVQGYTAARRAADVHEFIAAAVPARSRVLLVGWSLAALEALQYVHLYGEKRLAGLALIDSSVGEVPAPPGNNDPSADSPFKRRVRNDRPRFLDEFVHAIFAKPRPEEEIAALIAGAQRIKVEDSIALLSYPFPREHWKEVALKFSRPLLYVVTPQFAAQAASLKQHRPATRIENFKAGHALFADEPERFNRLLLDFAGSLR
ncbi:MAG: epoxide hydrolase [Betaproteobacteria bacterium]|nr:epoxide hydrolase [Betaproteobacteria bacterium]